MNHDDKDVNDDKKNDNNNSNNSVVASGMRLIEDMHLLSVGCISFKIPTETKKI